MRDKPQQIVFRMGRNRRAAEFFRGLWCVPFPRQVFETRAEWILHGGGFRGLWPRGIKRPVQFGVGVNMGLERERGIQHRFHALLAEFSNRRFDAVGLRGGMLDDVRSRHLLESRKQLVVFREIGVTQHVGGDQHVLGERIGADQVGMARIAGKHHLENPRMSHAAPDQLVDVAHAERPVRHSHRQAVDRDFHHESRRHQLEVNRVVIEPELACERLDARRVFGDGREHDQAASACPACC